MYNIRQLTAIAGHKHVASIYWSLSGNSSICHPRQLHTAVFDVNVWIVYRLSTQRRHACDVSLRCWS